MVNPSFVQSAYKPRDQQQLRRINYRHTKIRYFALTIAVFVVFGHQYCFDNPSALQSQIEHNLKDQSGESLGQAQFNLLYSLYSFPNVIIPLIGGMLIDRVGARIVLIITAIFCLLGQGIFGFGGFLNSFAVMLIGRMVFGVGGQVLHAAQNTIISNWFKASQLSMALGICISFPKLGSALNAYVSPSIAKAIHDQNPTSEQYWNVALPIFVGFCIMAVSLLLAVGLAILDKRSQSKQKIQHQSVLLSGKEREDSKPKGSPLKRSAKALNNSNREKSSSQNTIKSVKIVQQSGFHQNQPQGVQGGQHINLGDIKKLPISFWLLILVAMLSQALFIPFLDNGNKYYQKVFKNIQTAQEAGIYLILPYVVSSLLVPIMGYFVDKVGRRSNVLIISCAFFVFTYGFMLAVQTNISLRQAQWVRWVPTFLLGICVAIFCTVIVPTIPMLVKPKLLGTSFGLMEMIQNLGLATFPLISGAIRQSIHGQLAGFHRQTLFFFLISCLCLSISIFLKTADSLKGQRLNQKNFRNTYIKHVLKQED